MHHFVILHPENKGDDVEVKLINAYMNRLCIDEEDQNEVLQIYKWKPINTCILPNMAWTFISHVMLKNQMSIQEALGLVFTIDEWIHSFTQIEKEFHREIRPLHFLVGLPMIHFTDELLSFLSFELVNISLSDAFRSNCNLTLLQGCQESHTTTHNNVFTIGDDIEFLIFQLKFCSLSPNMSIFRLMDETTSSLVYTTVNEKSMTIQCKRKNYTLNVINNRYTAFLMFAKMLVPPLIITFTYSIIDKKFLDSIIRFRVRFIIKNIYDFVILTLMVWFMVPIFRLSILFAFSTLTRNKAHPTGLVFAVMPIFTASLFIMLNYKWVQPLSRMIVTCIEHFYCVEH